MEEQKIHILLVEDDEVDVMNIQRAFKQNNIVNPLYMAGNGLEALAILRGKGKIEPVMPQARRLILLDLNMPRMNGIEFLRELRLDKILRSIPVIILTTSNEDRDKVEAYNLNVAGYILKPVTFSNFVEVMATVNRYWMMSQIP